MIILFKVIAMILLYSYLKSTVHMNYENLIVTEPYVLYSRLAGLNKLQ